MRDDILKSIHEAIAASNKLLEDKAVRFIEDLSCLIVKVFQNNGKVLIAGNGGSLCDAMHFAEELTGFFRKKRKPLGAMAFSDPAHISCVSNDEGFEFAYSRLVEAYAAKQDLFIVMTTSGNSKNLIEAVKKAKMLRIKTVAFLGKDGGLLKNMCDYEWIVDGFRYSDRIQETHMAAIHIVIEMIENKLFYSKDDPLDLKKASLCSR